MDKIDTAVPKGGVQSLTYEYTWVNVVLKSSYELQCHKQFQAM